MKMRIVENNGKIEILCNNGTKIVEPSDDLLLNIFCNFKELERMGGVDGVWNDGCCDMSEYPGKTIAFINDYCNLTLVDSSLFVRLLRGNIKYISAQEYAEKHNKSVEVIKVHLRNGRIYGAKKVGNAWVIPEDSPYPTYAHVLGDKVINVRKDRT